MTQEGGDGKRYLVRHDGTLVKDGPIVMSELDRASARIVRALIDMREAAEADPDGSIWRAQQKAKETERWQRKQGKLSPEQAETRRQRKLLYEGAQTLGEIRRRLREADLSPLPGSEPVRNSPTS